MIYNSDDAKATHLVLHLVANGLLVEGAHATSKQKENEEQKSEADAHKRFRQASRDGFDDCGQIDLALNGMTMLTFIDIAANS